MFVHVPVDQLQLILDLVAEVADDLSPDEMAAVEVLSERLDARRAQTDNSVPIVAPDPEATRERGRARNTILAAATLTIAVDDQWHSRARVVAAVTPLLDNDARSKRRRADGSSLGSKVTERVKRFFQLLADRGDAELRVAGDQAQFRLLRRQSLEHIVSTGGLWPAWEDETVNQTNPAISTEASEHPSTRIPSPGTDPKSDSQ